MSHQRTVYLIDDDQNIRRSISLQLAQVGLEAWPFANGEEFVEMLGHLRPSVILLDMEMPAPGGLEVLAELVRREVDWPVIAISGRAELALAIDAMKLGAVDFLAKPLQADLLDTALSLSWTSLERSLKASVARQSAQERVARLTPREVDIGLALLRGMANKSAAHQLGISVRTVEMHRAHILEKLAVRSLAEAAVLMTQAGLTLHQPDDLGSRRRCALQSYMRSRAAVAPAAQPVQRAVGMGGALLRPAERDQPQRLMPAYTPALAGSAMR